ncbi:GCN5 family N-acetyltransferase [Thalassotalea insulae]|uniref:GCN5 family N-acetyltransferase n=1 Tax=Thalassotalea insulae TaxID=2056778 RepID=A0ABQ6GRG4_9GAMM|nr:GNAT family protein [Thalassotalea insulae]GLX77285.1 GCN5 family N-acetyltransferase [Thalassotalea insulae]
MSLLTDHYYALNGDTVTLIPLSQTHAQELVYAANDGELYNLWFTSVPNDVTINNYLDKAMTQLSAGTALPYVVMENVSGKVIGTTRLCNADSDHRRIEIGYTWYSKSYQRTAVNTEAKLLLLTHAFERLKVIAVEFRTHWHNLASRAAIARLGAKQDGVLRNHRIHSNGEYRDTVVFSIIEHEWPMVKKSLQFKTQQYR